MMKIRRASERGHANHGWLDTYHTFSFASYYDPKHMGFRALRVINDDTVAPGRGFGAHAHRDMEIVTYVLEGQLAHKDSTGEAHTFGANTIQAMSAGTGIVHSEYNASRLEPVHFLQIWIEPGEGEFPPSYQQIAIDAVEKRGKWRLIAGPVSDPAQPSALIHQDARMLATVLEPGQSVEHALVPERHAWVHVAQGQARVNGHALSSGDGVAISEESKVTVEGDGDGAEVILFDLA